MTYFNRDRREVSILAAINVMTDALTAGRMPNGQPLGKDAMLTYSRAIQDLKVFHKLLDEETAI